MTRLAMLVNLVMYAIVASQPLFYAVALSDASRALSAPAYIELRNAINAAMTRRVPAVYLGTLATNVGVLLLSLQEGERGLAATSAVALAALLADAAIMLRGNVPINRVIDSWTPSQYPADWEAHRSRWLAIFAVRQGLLAVGFVSLVAGAVFH